MYLIRANRVRSVGAIIFFGVVNLSDPVKAWAKPGASGLKKPLT